MKTIYLNRKRLMEAGWALLSGIFWPISIPVYILLGIIYLVAYLIAYLVTSIF